MVQKKPKQHKICSSLTILVIKGFKVLNLYDLKHLTNLNGITYTVLTGVTDKHSDKSKMMPVGTVQPMSHIQGPGQDTTSVSSLPVSESEDDQQGKGNNSWNHQPNFFVL